MAKPVVRKESLLRSLFLDSDDETDDANRDDWTVERPTLHRRSSDASDSDPPRRRRTASASSSLAKKAATRRSSSVSSSSDSSSSNSDDEEDDKSKKDSESPSDDSDASDNDTKRNNNERKTNPKHKRRRRVVESESDASSVDEPSPSTKKPIIKHRNARGRPVKSAVPAVLNLSISTHWPTPTTVDWSNLNSRDRQGRTQLHLFSYHGQLNEVRGLLAVGARANIRDHDGWLALHAAAVADQVQVVVALLDAGVDINSTTSSGDTALHLAAHLNHKEVTLRLLQRGARPNLVNHQGWSYVDVVGASLKPQLKTWMSHYQELFARDKHGQVKLHRMAAEGNIGEVRRLLSLGAAVNSSDNAGWACLHEAALAGHEDVVELILQNGADVNVHARDGDTPMHDAAENGYLAAVCVLLEHNADPSLRNNRGKTALDVAKTVEIQNAIRAASSKNKLIANHVEPEQQSSVPRSKKTHKSSTQNLNNQEQEKTISNAPTAVTTQSVPTTAPATTSTNASVPHATIAEVVVPITSTAAATQPEDLANSTSNALDSQRRHHHHHRRKHHRHHSKKRPHSPSAISSDADGNKTVLNNDSAVGGVVTEERRHRHHHRKRKHRTVESDKESEGTKSDIIVVETSAHEASVPQTKRSRHHRHEREPAQDGSLSDAVSTPDGSHPQERRHHRRHRRHHRRRDDNPESNVSTSAEVVDNDEHHGSQNKRKIRKRVDADQINNLAATSDHAAVQTPLKPALNNALLAIKPEIILDKVQEHNSTSEQKDPLPSESRPNGHGLKRLVSEDQAGRDIDAQNKHGRTRLMRCAINGDVEGVLKCMKAFATVNVADVNGATALHLAAIHGWVDIVRILILNGAQPDMQDSEGDTALHEAAFKGHKDVIDALLSGHASLTIRNDEGKTPLDLTTDLASRQSLELAYSKSSSERPVQALKRAASSDSLSTSTKARSAAPVERRSLSNSASKPVANVHKRDGSGRTQLHRAARSGDVDMATDLLDRGADVNAADNGGWTPLHEAALRGNIVALLLRRGANVNAIAENQDSPLHDASENGHVDVVKLLISHRADVTLRNRTGETPAEVTSDENISALFKRADIDVKSIDTNDSESTSTKSHGINLFDPFSKDKAHDLTLVIETETHEKPHEVSSSTPSTSPSLTDSASVPPLFPAVPNQSTIGSTRKKGFLSGITGYRKFEGLSPLAKSTDYSPEAVLTPPSTTVTFSAVVKTESPSPLLANVKAEPVEMELLTAVETKPTMPLVVAVAELDDKVFVHEPKAELIAPLEVTTTAFPQWFEPVRSLPLFAFRLGAGLITDDTTSTSISNPSYFPWSGPFLLDLQVAILMNIDVLKLNSMFPTLPRRPVSFEERQRLLECSIPDVLRQALQDTTSPLHLIPRDALLAALGASSAPIKAEPDTPLLSDHNRSAAAAAAAALMLTSEVKGRLMATPISVDLPAPRSSSSLPPKLARKLANTPATTPIGGAPPNATSPAAATVPLKVAIKSKYGAHVNDISPRSTSPPSPTPTSS